MFEKQSIIKMNMIGVSLLVLFSRSPLRCVFMRGGPRKGSDDYTIEDFDYTIIVQITLNFPFKIKIIPYFIPHPPGFHDFPEFSTISRSPRDFQRPGPGRSCAGY